MTIQDEIFKECLDQLRQNQNIPPALIDELMMILSQQSSCSQERIIALINKYSKNASQDQKD